jgi:hypothetical protein
METLLKVLFFAGIIFSIGYCAAVRIAELREEKHAGPTQQEPAPAKKGFHEFKEWTINFF